MAFFDFSKYFSSFLFYLGPQACLGCFCLYAEHTHSHSHVCKHGHRHIHTHMCTLACATLASLAWSECPHGPSILLFPCLAGGPGHFFVVSWESKGILRQENGVYLLSPQLPLGSLAHPPPQGDHGFTEHLYLPTFPQFINRETGGRTPYKAVCCPLVKSWGITSRGLLVLLTLSPKTSLVSKGGQAPSAYCCLWVLSAQLAVW